MLHGGVIEYAVRRVFLFEVHDLERQYPELCSKSNVSQSEEIKEACGLLAHLMDLCKQSILIHISNYLGHDHHQFMMTQVGYAMNVKFHTGIMEVGSAYYLPPYSKSWAKMKALSNFLTVCVGSEEDDENTLREFEDALANQNRHANRQSVHRGAAPAA